MRENKLKGIGGWLLVFVILQGYGILSGLSSLIYSLTGFNKQQLELIENFGLNVNILPMSVEIGIGVVTLGLSIASFTLILKKSKKATSWTQASLWVGFISGVASIWYMLPDYAYIIIPLVGVLMGAYVIAWSVYFVRSKRVKNTLIR